MICRLDFRRPTAARKSRRGFTLVEVLVAITIFSTGLLGMAALLASSAGRSVRSTTHAEISAAAEAKLEELRSDGMTGRNDPLRARLTVGGSTASPVAGYVDSTVSLTGRWYRRTWEVSNGVAGARRVTVRVFPIGNTRYATKSRQFTSLVALL